MISYICQFWTRSNFTLSQIYFVKRSSTAVCLALISKWKIQQGNILVVSWCIITEKETNSLYERAQNYVKINQYGKDSLKLRWC